MTLMIGVREEGRARVPQVKKTSPRIKMETKAMKGLLMTHDPGSFFCNVEVH